jgi:ribosome maturation factor RimP
MNEKIDQITVLLTPLIADLGFDLQGCEFVPQSRRGVLRIFVEKSDGSNIALDDCAKLSRPIGALLDVENVFPGGYYLEVSSPGLDRRLFTLEQCARFIGKKIKCQLWQAIEGRKNVVGLLQTIIETKLVIVAEEITLTVPFDQIKKANLVY